MKISVVIPTFNRLWALPRSVRQFYANPLVGEIIVINDCSTDGAREWLEQEARIHPSLRVFHQPVNRGLTSARNLGIEIVQNEYFLFWDDDMLLMPSDGLQILLNELLRHRGDIISPGFAVQEGNLLPNPLFPADTPGDLARSEVLLDRRILMVHRLTPVQLPAGTFQSPLLFSWTLQKRKLYQDVRYADDLAPTYFREETDVHLAFLERNCRLLACPFVYALDMKRPIGQGDGGCHSHGTLLRYDFYACRNNWRMLRRRRGAIRRALGIRRPVILLQVVFVAVILFYRLPRRLVGMLLRRAGLRR